MADVRRLPIPVTALWDWQMHAECRNVDTAVFFHPESERGPAKRTRDSHAKAFCLRCPVIEACRLHALNVQEPYGVWGGLTVDERAEILHGHGQADAGVPVPPPVRPAVTYVDNPHRPGSP